MTPPYIMVDVLTVNLPGQKDSNGAEFQWLSLHFEYGAFSLQKSSGHEELFVSTLDDLNHMLAAIARRAARMWICRSPDYVTCLLNNL
jgi:hypothetical protein